MRKNITHLLTAFAVLALVPATSLCGQNVIKLTTGISVGKKIEIEITAKGALSIDGVKENAQAGYHSYTIQKQDLTITGDVTGLTVWEAKLTGLDISGNTLLESVDCSDNELEALDLTKNTSLKELRCQKNKITTLDLTQCKNLELIYCYSNKLQALNLKNNDKLATIYCGGNTLSSLDVSGCTALSLLGCDNVGIDVLDVSKCTKLVTLFCPENKLASLDLSNNPELINASCYDNKLTSLNVSGCNKLEMLDVHQNMLNTMELPNSITLKTVAIYLNKLKEDGMKKIVSTLPNYSGSKVDVKLIVLDSMKLKSDGSTVDENVFSKENVSATKAKNWTPYYRIAEDTYKEYTGITAISEISTQEIVAYPNPATENVQMRGLKPCSTVTLRDLNGNLFYEAQSDAEGNITIDVARMPRGYCLLSANGKTIRLLLR